MSFHEIHFLRLPIEIHWIISKLLPVYDIITLSQTSVCLRQVYGPISWERLSLVEWINLRKDSLFSRSMAFKVILNPDPYPWFFPENVQTLIFTSESNPHIEEILRAITKKRFPALKEVVFWAHCACENNPHISSDINLQQYTLYRTIIQRNALQAIDESDCLTMDMFRIANSSFVFQLALDYLTPEIIEGINTPFWGSKIECLWLDCNKEVRPHSIPPSFLAESCPNIRTLNLGCNRKISSFMAAKGNLGLLKNLKWLEFTFYLDDGRFKTLQRVFEALGDVPSTLDSFLIRFGYSTRTPEDELLFLDDDVDDDSNEEDNNDDLGVELLEPLLQEQQKYFSLVTDIIFLPGCESAISLILIYSLPNLTNLYLFSGEFESDLLVQAYPKHSSATDGGIRLLHAEFSLKYPIQAFPDLCDYIDLSTLEYLHISFDDNISLANVPIVFMELPTMLRLEYVRIIFLRRTKVQFGWLKDFLLKFFDSPKLIQVILGNITGSLTNSDVEVLASHNFDKMPAVKGDSFEFWAFDPNS